MESFKYDERAIFVSKNGDEWPVIIKSHPTSHDDAPQGIRVIEAYFLDSPEGAGMFAVNAAQFRHYK